MVARLFGAGVAGLAMALTEEPGSFPLDYRPPDSWPELLIVESAADRGTVSGEHPDVVDQRVEWCHD
jgi:hypothetical protein